VEQLYLDSISPVEQFIYIENEYLSSHQIGQALARRLKAADGPYVVIVLPEKFRTGNIDRNAAGVVVIALLADRVSDALRQPGPYHIAVLVGAVVLANTGMTLMRRWSKEK
jgi:hypothetical protein